ncbi:hypothetical protein ACOKGD_09915 [Microbacterium phosphatis]|uniref:hypothetical protein n=1 Tax=Microbacterium phosphatis TaxID=3140248 RepID=UPI0031406ECD
MSAVAELVARTGLLLPESFLTSEWFAVLAAFVAVNTLMYVALATVKIVPKFRINWRGRSRRSETRSIHPDAPV